MWLDTVKPLSSSAVGPGLHQVEGVDAESFNSRVGCGLYFIAYG